MVAGAGFVGLSSDSWLGINKETVYGTAAGPTSSEDFLFLSETLKSETPLIPVPNISAAFQDVSQQFSGAKKVSGDVELAVPFQGLETLLLHCFGAVSTINSASGVYDSTFDLSSRGRFRSTTSPSLSFHVSRGVVGSGASNPTVFTYSGCVIDSFKFTCGRDQPLKLSASVFGRRETLAVYSGSTSFPTASIARFNQCLLTWANVKIPLVDFTIEVSRGIDKERFFAGDLYSNEPPMGQYAIKISATTEWDNEIRAGSTTLQADYDAKTARSLKFNFTSDDFITGTTAYQFNLAAGNAIIETFAPNVTQRGRVLVPITWIGFDSDITTAPHGLRLTTKSGRNFSDT